ncbi:mariner Mos1 transposase [Trichonephila clavipes]|nr:mariner Mos1 transposase [Trichonephila clavipes]
MESDKQHFRHILLFYYRKGKNAVQARKKLTDVYGEGVLTVRQCQNWFAKFRSGNFDVEDAPLYDHLKGLGLSSKLYVWVPHVLTERDLCRRIDVCDSLLKRHENDSFLKRIISGDEKGHGAKKMNRLKPFPKPIFTKKSTKATHLEVVSDLITEAFLSCLRQFIARRSKPSVIWSDNATNFKGARNILKDWDETCKFNTIQRGIEWNFIPLTSPRFGGLWEANIKSMKRILLRVAKLALMNFEEFTTLVAQIEAVLNSRPFSSLPSMIFTL